MNDDNSKPDSAIHSSIDDMLREIGAAPRRAPVKDEPELFENMLASIEQGTDAGVNDSSSVSRLEQPAGEAAGRKTSRYLVFEVGAAILAIPSHQLREVVECPPVTPIPWGGPWLQGITNRRGEVLAVLDLSALSKAPGRRLGRTRLAVVESAGDTATGFLADRVLGMRGRLEEELFAPSQLESAIFSPHASGFFIEADRQVPILDVDSLLTFLATSQRDSGESQAEID